jgi:tetratricopeptide (TPR) repeat protein
MSANLPADFCPYKGLQPYTEQDRPFFFGRDRDQQIVISNLYAAQLTVLYGASGVGKSSVLLAGSVPLLKQERNLSVVVFRSWQDPKFLQQLKEKTLATVSGNSNKEISADTSLPLDEFLAQLSRAARGLIFFIFDQFEEYFLYNALGSYTSDFEAEFARAVNRRDINANFLLSMREDSLSKLDRFQGRIPALLNNMLRLEHLDRNAAREAIIRPLEQYNRLISEGQPHITVEPELVRATLDDMEGARPGADQFGQGAVAKLTQDPKSPIETPFLQMVLTRLWNEERSEGSHALRMQTFERLGRAPNIARTHLDTMMAKLSQEERDGAANILRYLVTPSGTKIAQEAGALTSWTELGKEQVEGILNRLSGPDMRILRTVQAPGQPVLYEIFHDVLAQAVLNWRRRYVALQEQEQIRREEQQRRAEELDQAERRREKELSQTLRRALITLSLLFPIMLSLTGFALWQMQRAQAEKKIANDAKREAEEKKDKIESLSHMNKGQLFLQRKKFDDAVKEYDEAIKLDPLNPAAYASKGYAQIRAGDKTGQYDTAINTLEYLISKVDSSYALGHYNLALAYWKAKRPEDAMKEAKAVLNLGIGFCDTFKGDSNYKWFVDSEDYKNTCRTQAATAQ